MAKKKQQNNTNKTKVNWKTEISPRSRNRELMIAKIQYGGRKLNEQKKSIDKLGDLERNKANSMLQKFGAIKHNKKSIDNFYHFTDTNDIGDVTIRYSKRELEKLTDGQLRKILKGIEGLHDNKTFSTKGMRKYFKTVRNKIWTTLSDRYKSKYSNELWNIIENHKDTVIQRVLDNSGNGSNRSSDQEMEDYIKEMMESKEAQAILQDTIERDQKAHREVENRRNEYERDKPKLQRRMYRNRNRR